MKYKNKSFESESQQEHRRQGFVPEVQHHKGAYVSVEEPIKDGLLSTLNPPRTTT
jgi:hypothetical protein